MLKLTLISMMLSCVIWAETTNVSLLIDTSGSMKGKESEIKSFVFKVMKEQKDMDIFLFNNDVKKVDKNKPLKIYPKGGTNLSYALSKVANDDTKAIILITDGEPSSPKRVLKEVEKLKAKKTVICSSFIGNNSRRPEILEKISDVFLVNESLKGSLDECLSNAKIKKVLQPSYEEKIKPKYKF